MKLTHLANQRMIVSRLVAVSGTSNRLALATTTGYNVHLQAISFEKAQQVIPGVNGKPYKIFVDADYDIREGDQLKDESGNIYTVRKGGVTRWQHGAMDYKEIFVIQS